MARLRLVETPHYVQEHFDQKTRSWVLCDSYPCHDAALHRSALCGMPFGNELGLQYCHEPIGHEGPHRDRVNETY